MTQFEGCMIRTVGLSQPAGGQNIEVRCSSKAPLQHLGPCFALAAVQKDKFAMLRTTMQTYQAAVLESCVSRRTVQIVLSFAPSAGQLFLA